MDEILFGTSGKSKVKLAQALKQARAKKEVDVKPKKSEKWSSSTQSDSDDDDYGRGRYRRKRSQGDRISAAARLKQKAAAMEQSLRDTPPPGDPDEGLASSEEKKMKESTPPPSPIPSPPPLVYFNPESKQSQTLMKADMVLMELRMSTLSDSLLDQSSGLDDSIIMTTPSSIATALADSTSFTLRVRCRGKIHRFTVNKDDPLILLCSKLGEELGVKGEQILLSHSTATLSTSSSPASLGLSTVDIIDAIVVLDDQLQVNGETDISHDPENCITLKVQSTKKTTTYSIARNEGLSKVMTAFAAALGLPVNTIKFTFDGDPISPDHTPSRLDMEDGDIIDARVLVS